jgi:hypothetical protein
VSNGAGTPPVVPGSLAREFGVKPDAPGSDARESNRALSAIARTPNACRIVLAALASIPGAVAFALDARARTASLLLSLASRLSILPMAFSLEFDRRIVARGASARLLDALSNDPGESSLDAGGVRGRASLLAPSPEGLSIVPDAFASTLNAFAA